MGQTIKGLLALSVSTIAVHAMYIIVIRPKAMMIDVLVAQGQPELTRSIWIILRDFEQEVYKVNRDGKEFYRLGITGFPSLVIAEDICARLTDGGEQCVPATRDH